MKKAAYKLHLKKDDIVEVISGKEKGKKGKILAIFATQERATVEKLNMVKRHTKGDGKSRQSAIIEKEGKIHISEKTADHLGEKGVFTPRGEINLKNKGIWKTFYLEDLKFQE